MNLLVVGHGGSGNRGCEAILRTSAEMWKRACPSLSLRVASFAPTEDAHAALPHVDEFIAGGSWALTRGSIPWLKRLFCRHVLRDPMAAARVTMRGTLRAIPRADVCISIGGDNYCYDPPYWLYAVHREARRLNKRTVLWGASVEPQAIDSHMREDLAGFDIITARESITYETLRTVNTNVHLYPDPAFTMEAEELALPPGWRDEGMVGLNVSPLIVGRERTTGVVLRAAAALIDRVLRTTDMGILLVPHVTWPHSNDDAPLRRLHERFASTGRVLLLPSELTAPQYKGYIARCKYFVGARTHATIAAYSSCVPTLVIGYSVKARGIARDIFGDESSVLPVSDLTQEGQLPAAFSAMMERSQELRTTLARQIPLTQARAAQAAARVFS